MRLIIAFFASMLAIAPVFAEMRGHGGPVRALSASPDGATAISGSFDTSAIIWNISEGSAEQVLRLHEGSVNAVLALGDGRYVTAGEDGRIAFWNAGEVEPQRVVTDHTAPVVALALSPDRNVIASASWDRTVRLTNRDGETVRVLEGHQDNVNGVAFAPDGAIVTAGYDATVRIWPADGSTALVAPLPTPLNAVAVTGDDKIVAAGADGMLRILDMRGERLAEIEAQPLPIIALGLSPDGTRVAAAGVRGSVAIIDLETRETLVTLVGPGLPVWSLAFAPDGETLLTGGSDRIVRRWDAQTGEHIGPVVMSAPESFLAQFEGSRGAEVFRACAACHTLSPDDGNRAGPTLHGIFGRRIATAPGYGFSPALKEMDIVWTPETVSKLFEIGPTLYTPGTKMPEQKITDPDDRAALMEFLQKATADR
ncbi:MAG TPA: c-type cytochrome [Saliniramus sp.]|nr:c-type cytochrome [Saliniramus sp.]